MTSAWRHRTRVAYGHPRRDHLVARPVRKSPVPWPLAVLLAMSTWLAPLTVAAAIVQGEPVVLNTQDRLALATLACGAAGGVPAERIEAGRAKYASRAPIEANVTCASRAGASAYPIRTIARCSNERGRWECAARDYLEYRGDGGAASISYGETPQAPIVVDIIRYVLNIRRYDGRDLRELVAGQRCDLEDASANQWILRCSSGADIRVGRLCTERGCRFEVVGLSISIA